MRRLTRRWPFTGTKLLSRGGGDAFATLQRPLVKTLVATSYCELCCVSKPQLAGLNPSMLFILRERRIPSSILLIGFGGTMEVVRNRYPGNWNWCKLLTNFSFSFEFELWPRECFRWTRSVSGCVAQNLIKDSSLITHCHVTRRLIFSENARRNAFFFFSHCNGLYFLRRRFPRETTKQELQMHCFLFC